jgi:hypothetical protein
MMLVIAVVTVLVAALAPAAGAAQDAAPPAAPVRRGGPLCAEISVSAPSLGRPVRDWTFSSREVLDLRLEARLRRTLRGPHVLRFKVLTPAGFLYQVVTVPFVGTTERRPAEAGDAAPAEAVATRVEAEPTRAEPAAATRVEPEAAAAHTEPVAAAGHTRGQSVSALLPVAGTSITQSSLFGRWTVEPYLDDEAEACGPPARFTIRE